MPLKSQVPGTSLFTSTASVFWRVVKRKSESGFQGSRKSRSSKWKTSFAKNSCWFFLIFREIWCAFCSQDGAKCWRRVQPIELMTSTCRATVSVALDMPAFLSVYACLYVSACLFMSACLFVSPVLLVCVCMSFCLYLSLCVCLSVCICLCICLFVCICLSVYICVSVWVCLSVHVLHLSIFLYVTSFFTACSKWRCNVSFSYVAQQIFL